MSSSFRDKMLKFSAKPNLYYLMPQQGGDPLAYRDQRATLEKLIKPQVLGGIDIQNLSSQDFTKYREKVRDLMEEWTKKHDHYKSIADPKGMEVSQKAYNSLLKYWNYYLFKRRFQTK